MTVKLNPGQVAALNAAAAGAPLTATQARNLLARGLVVAVGDGLALTPEAHAALALVAAQRCGHDEECTLGPAHTGDHVTAEGYRRLNWHEGEGEGDLASGADVFTQYRVSTALGAIVAAAEELCAELAKPRPTSRGNATAHLSSPEWLALLDARSRSAEAVERYDAVTGTDAGASLARTALVYAGEKDDAARAWARFRENSELFPMRIDDTGARACDARALATLRRIVDTHQHATGQRLGLVGTVRP